MKKNAVKARREVTAAMKTVKKSLPTPKELEIRVSNEELEEQITDIAKERGVKTNIINVKI